MSRSLDRLYARSRRRRDDLRACRKELNHGVLREFRA